jgi:predicted DNA-binding antitoxin AbrB/MazE fold protein
MTIEVEAIYENGTLKLDRPLPLKDQERVRVTIHPGPGRIRRGYGLIQWPGTLEDLDALINDPENDPLEAP